MIPRYTNAVLDVQYRSLKFSILPWYYKYIRIFSRYLFKKYLYPCHSVIVVCFVPTLGIIMLQSGSQVDTYNLEDEYIFLFQLCTNSNTAINFKGILPFFPVLPCPDLKGKHRTETLILNTVEKMIPCDSTLWGIFLEMHQENSKCSSPHIKTRLGPFPV